MKKEQQNFINNVRTEITKFIYLDYPVINRFPVGEQRVLRGLIRGELGAAIVIAVLAIFKL